jgi:hypothetical protein
VVRLNNIRTLTSALCGCSLCIIALQVTAQQHFSDVSVQAGIRHVFVPYQGTFGGGATVVDFDKDGYEDVFVAGGTADDALYHNNKDGTFTDIFAKAGLKTDIKYVTQGAVSADVNKDGWVDLFITTINTLNNSNVVPRAQNLLFLNNGDLTFTNATKDFGLDRYLTFTTGAAFGDVNGDGYPDLFISNYFKEYKGELNILNDALIVNSGQMGEALFFINKTGKYFKEQTEEYGVKTKGFGFGGTFTDFDNDGDLDLIVNNDFGYKAIPNFLFENLFPEKVFKDVSKEMNMRLNMNGMGTAVGDYNNDGWLDYFFTNIRTNQFMLNQGKGNAFLNQSLKLGTGFSFSDDSLGRYTPISWGCNFADFDNDTDLDLFVSCGSLNPNVEPNPDFYFENVNGQYESKAVMVGLLNRGIGRGSVTFDYDNDGDLDLLVVNQQAVSDGLGTESVTQLFRNDNSLGNNWIKLALEGIEADAKGIGARVEIWTGKTRMIREVDGGSSHISQNSTIAHFGLASLTTIDSAVVSWVGGKRQVVLAPPVNKLIHVMERVPEKSWGLLDGIIILTIILSAILILILFFKKIKGKSFSDEHTIQV